MSNKDALPSIKSIGMKYRFRQDKSYALKKGTHVLTNRKG